MIFQRETEEFLPIEVQRNGEPATTNVMLAITPATARPTTWTPAETLGDEIGITIQGLTPGMYRVWAKVTTAAEVPVLHVATFEVA